MTYDTRQPPRAPTLRETVLIGNAARARLFERDPDNGAMRELADFVHPPVAWPTRSSTKRRPPNATSS